VSDPTPLTEEALNALERASDAAREAYHEVGEGSGAAAGARRGFKSAHAFYSERERALLLTPKECRAVRLAMIFGKPDQGHPALDSAAAKLKAIEARAALGLTDPAPSTTEGAPGLRNVLQEIADATQGPSGNRKKGAILDRVQEMARVAVQRYDAGQVLSALRTRRACDA